ncbi:hypothetical protein IWT25_00742 [Secundilactobacillus pentosiphilus]|uniref:Uncharacterized protein n=1 Tax=Secundilactobacillus pentosiphilus TaxID=1714682 RepID=A0A1Z5IV02_9LACO|nr:hypothetical protein [Secundilactobacillus pentosiphilus]GAX05438.1 hypothetical protein IWT25_00742 [Secundilactobacillus pentosiphilus]
MIETGKHSDGYFTFKGHQLIQEALNDWFDFGKPDQSFTDYFPSVSWIKRDHLYKTRIWLEQIEEVVDK